MHGFLPLALVTAGIITSAETAQRAAPTYQQVVAGNGYSCALDQAGAVWCWGQSEFGIFGDRRGSPSPVRVAADFTFKTIVSGSMRVCGLAVDGGAYCWGDNRNSGLGVPSGRDCMVEYVGQIDCATRPVRVSGSHRFDALASGASHTCGLSGFAIHCWGANHVGQLGDGTRKPRSAPVPVSGNLQFESVIAAGSSSCGRVGGYYYCWGMYPRAPIGDSASSFSPVPVQLASLIAHAVPGSCGLSISGSTTCRGELYDPMTRIGVGGATVSFDEPRLISLSSGTSSISCGLAERGVAYCWNTTPNSGIGGPLESMGAPTAISGEIAFTQLAMGFNHVCGLSADGQVYCWGLNTGGQLGDGSTRASASPRLVLPPIGE